jgi:hypothetical protein
MKTENEARESFTKNMNETADTFNRNVNETRETFSKNVNNATDWLSKSSSMMGEVYQKQFELSMGIYNEVINSTFLNTAKNNHNRLDLFEKNVNLLKDNFEKNQESFKEILHTMMSSFSKQQVNPKEGMGMTSDLVSLVMDTYARQMQMISNFNLKYFNTLNKQFNPSNMNLTEVYDKVQAKLRDSFEASKERIKTAAESYSNETRNVAGSNSGLLGEINKQVNSMVNSNLKYWSEFLEDFSNEAKSKTKDFFNESASRMQTQQSQPREEYQPASKADAGDASKNKGQGKK